MKITNMEHGSPYDRGSADSYYRRPYNPHWYPLGSYKGEKIGIKDMTEQQIVEYKYGYEENEKAQIYL